jgi:hypothetical protein
MSIVTLALAKEFLEITHTAQDNVVQMLLNGAEDYLSKRLGVHFASSEYIEEVDGGAEWLFLKHLPVSAVESVVDLWSDDAELSCKLINNSRLIYADAVGVPLGKWPKGERRYRVTYTAGHAAMPDIVKTVVCMLVRRAYEARGGEASVSAAGASMNFAKFFDSDMWSMVREYSFRRHIST